MIIKENYAKKIRALKEVYAMPKTLLKDFDLKVYAIIELYIFNSYNIENISKMLSINKKWVWNIINFKRGGV